MAERTPLPPPSGTARAKGSYGNLANSKGRPVWYIGSHQKKLALDGWLLRLGEGLKVSIMRQCCGKILSLSRRTNTF